MPFIARVIKAAFIARRGGVYGSLSLFVERLIRLDGKFLYNFTVKYLGARNGQVLRAISRCRCLIKTVM